MADTGIEQVEARLQRALDEGLVPTQSALTNVTAAIDDVREADRAVAISRLEALAERLARTDPERKGVLLAIDELRGVSNG